MIWQLRTYRIRPGAMSAFREVWSAHVVPSRRTHGFEVKGGWFDSVDDTFIWLVGHPDPDSWHEAERAYYDDPGRTAWPDLGPDLIVDVRTRMLREA